jgi:type V secretory pathway adhesin AidA
MKPIVFLMIVAAAEILVASASAQGACPNGARGGSALTTATHGSEPTSTGSLASPYLQQAYWQQQYLQQQYDLEQQEEPSRQSRIAARQERKAAEQARREAAKAKKAHQRDSASGLAVQR